jgi:hypothetical protein
MGLISGLLTLPLSPLRGTVWLAERLQEQVEAELSDASAIRGKLLELEELRATGELDEAELTAAEDALVERLMRIREQEGVVADGAV